MSRSVTIPFALRLNVTVEITAHRNEDGEAVVTGARLPMIGNSFSARDINEALDSDDALDAFDAAVDKALAMVGR